MTLKNQGPLSLADLLELDSRFPNKAALPDNFGDRYLYANNYVFKNIRDLSLKAGFTYGPPEKINYLCGPYACLGRILRTKMIPYAPTTPHLEEVDSDCPGKITMEDLQNNMAIVRVNPLIHEAAHAISHTLIPPATNPKTRANPTQILRHHLAESFALTVELMGRLPINSEVHLLFFWKNANVLWRPNDESLMLSLYRLQASHGFDHAYKLVMISYLYSLCLYDGIGAAQKERIRKVMKSNAPWDPEELGALKFILPYCFGLNRVFRLTTSEFYFKQRGIESDIQKIHDFDPLLVLSRDHELMKAVNILSDFAFMGEKSQYSKLLEISTSTKLKITKIAG